MIDNQIYGYADSLLVGLEYMVTSLYSDSRLKGANLYQGDSSSLTFELLDQDDNIVELCSRGTTEYVLPKDVCASNASSVEFASASLPCRFKHTRPTISLAALMKAAGVDINKENQKWFDSCAELYRNDLFSPKSVEDWRDVSNYLYGDPALGNPLVDIDSLDHMKAFVNSSHVRHVCAMQAIPRFGTGLVLTLEYDNRNGDEMGDIYVKGRVEALPLPFIPIGRPRSHFAVSRNGLWRGGSQVADFEGGISISVVHDGLVCKFSFQAILLTFTSGLGLLALAAVITDIAMGQMDPRLSSLKSMKVNGSGHRLHRNMTPAASAAFDHHTGQHPTTHGLHTQNRGKAHSKKNNCNRESLDVAPAKFPHDAHRAIRRVMSGPAGSSRSKRPQKTMEMRKLSPEHGSEQGAPSPRKRQKKKKRRRKT